MLALLSGGCVSAWAQPVSPNSPDDIKRRELEAVQQEKQRAFEQQALQKPSQAASVLKYLATPSSRPCLALTPGDFLDGAGEQPVGETFPEVQGILRTVVEGVAGQCVHADDAQQLGAVVQSAFAVQGYEMVRVLSMHVDEAARVLRLRMLMPRVASIHTEGTSTGSRSHLLGAVRVGRLFNVLDVDQAIENRRLVPRADLAVRVLQDDNDPAQVHVQALLQAGASGSVGQELGSSPSPALHHYQSSSSASLYELLSESDSLSFSHSAIPYHYRHRPSQTSSSLDYALAHGYWLFGLGLRSSATRQQVASGDDQLAYDSKQQNLVVRMERVVYRNPSEVLRFKASLGKRHADAELGGQAIDVQRRRLATASWGLAWRRQAERYYLDIDVARHHSPAIFDAQDDFEPVGDGPRPSFRNGHYAMSLYFQQTLGRIADLPVLHDLTLQAQHGSRPQYASEHLSIGGAGTVRGFSGADGFSGESGYFLRNDFSVPGCMGVKAMTCYAALDHGRITRNHLAPSQQGSLTGVALGLRANAAGFYADVSLARAVVNSGRPLEGRDVPVVTARIGYRHSF